MDLLNDSLQFAEPGFIFATDQGHGMIYLEHFGLTETPFSLTPDTGFYFNYLGHQQALNVLLVALRSGEGFLKITGEVGTGKTMLCRKLLATLDDSYCSAYLPNPLLGPTELHQAIAAEIGVERLESNQSLHELQTLILDRALALQRTGRRVVICVDEAQAMSDVSLEALRLLSNLETEKSKLLQIVLFAQPELDVRLEQENFRQLRQRISFAQHLLPLDREGVHAYIAHRMLISGDRNGDVFLPKAIDQIYRASKGVPRLVNILAHKGLLAAFGAGHKTVDVDHVRIAIRDTAEAQLPFQWKLSPTLLWGLALVTIVELALVAYLLL
ncbi:MAG TPA: AAA family ATPase [Geothermobacteraceae bacterium]|nr:AAA family ATPase [Geothermobacteraceae bacterium]